MTNDHRKNLSQPADSIDRSKNGPSAESIDAQWPSLLTEVIEHATVGVFITDANGVILYANQHHCEQSGYDLEEIIGQNPKMFQSGKTSRDIYENMWATIRAGNT